jgi:hypothetical protein
MEDPFIFPLFVLDLAGDYSSVASVQGGGNIGRLGSPALDVYELCAFFDFIRAFITRLAPTACRDSK